MSTKILKSKIGDNFIIDIFGGSHEDEIGVTIKGLPAPHTISSIEDLKKEIDFSLIDEMLSRRKPLNKSISTSRLEADEFEIRSVNPLTFVIKNKNVKKDDYNLRFPRPSHCDFPAHIKYGDSVNLSGGGPFSGRMTAPMVIAGAVTMNFLKKIDINIQSHILSIGNVYDKYFSDIDSYSSLKFSDPNFQVLDDNKINSMKAQIIDAKEVGDSIGGSIEAIITGMPIGIGGPMFEGLESKLSPYLFAIPAVKGLSFGLGFESSKLKGSEYNDQFKKGSEEKPIRTTSNNSGGILGGLSTGEPIILTLALKPTPSISKKQTTIDLNTGEETTLGIQGRHDPCIVPRACVVLESLIAISLLDTMISEGYFAKHKATCNDDISMLRNNIDNIDIEIAQLLSKRMKVSKEIGIIKKSSNTEILDADREEEVLKKVLLNSKDEYKDEIKSIYKNIMKSSKSLQRKLGDNHEK